MWEITEEGRTEAGLIRLMRIGSALLEPPIGPGSDLATPLPVTAKMPAKQRRRA